MALSWKEIKSRALNFSKEWANTTNEDARCLTCSAMRHFEP